MIRILIALAASLFTLPASAAVMYSYVFEGTYSQDSSILPNVEAGDLMRWELLIDPLAGYDEPSGGTSWLAQDALFVNGNTYASGETYFYQGGYGLDALQIQTYYASLDVLLTFWMENQFGFQSTRDSSELLSPSDIRAIAPTGFIDEFWPFTRRGSMRFVSAAVIDVPSVPSVPAPGALGLLGIGLVGLGLRARRRASQKQE